MGAVSLAESAAALLQRPAEEQQRLGYFHTLREICQQPDTWRDTCERMLGQAARVERALAGIRGIVFTGSGSSEYAGHCASFPLQRELGVVTQTIGGGTLLTLAAGVIPPERPGLVVSLARSGESPESAGVLDVLLGSEPELRHLILTCNEHGNLATDFRGDPRVTVIVLDERTNDRSLVMTSSFTNMVLAARFAGFLGRRDAYRNLIASLSEMAEHLIRDEFSAFARVAALPFNRVVFLGSGARFGSARESALKMLEMTAGRVTTMAETWLGFRHGPMTYAHKDALIVCFLSSDPLLRAYETDLLSELDDKQLGLARLIVGDNVPTGLTRGNDVVVECAGLAEAGDANSPVIDVIAGQLLAFFRCLREGLRPDSPSESGVINRVVRGFTLHHVNGEGKV